MKTILIILATAAVAITGTLFFKSGKTSASAATDRKPLYYQSAMHPWIKSDKPGRCTICGMELTPVYPGEKGFDATTGGNTVALSNNQIQVLDVRTSEAKIQPLSHNLTVAGVIDDDVTRHRVLSAYVDARIDILYLDHVGAEIEAGQPIAEIYSPTLLQAGREYRQLTGELQSATALRLQQMGLTPEQISKVKNQPSDTLTSQILSPISGTVVARNVYQGQYVTAGEKLFEIADFSTMWFMFDAYETDMPWIKLGQSVTISTPAIAGKTYSGKISFIDPNFDEVTRATKVRVELDNPKINGRRELFHKLYAEAAVHHDTPNVFAVPRSAVIQTGPEAVVYRDNGGGAYEQVPVKIGRRGDALVEILSGLKSGDKVVTTGTLLIDGQAELNHSFTTPVVKPADTTAELTAAQQEIFTRFVTLADSMSAALAGDDLTKFNKASESTMATTMEFIAALNELPVEKENVEALAASRHFHQIQDLKEARAAYYRFSTAASAIIDPLRRIKNFPEVQIWECPMVDQAVPNAAKTGRWLQTGKRPGTNPYFGKEMIDCGKEIKP